MTNKGLQIRLQFVSLPSYPGQFIALLNCYPPSLPGHRVGLHVRLQNVDDEDAYTSLEDGTPSGELLVARSWSFRLPSSRTRESSPA